MIAIENIRTEIQQRLLNISQEKLKMLLDFVIRLEKEDDKDIMSYAGMWSDMDDDTFTELTTGLPEKRMSENSDIMNGYEESTH